MDTGVVWVFKPYVIVVAISKIKPIGVSRFFAAFFLAIKVLAVVLLSFSSLLRNRTATSVFSRNIKIW